jgi:hypothetical protein
MGQLTRNALVDSAELVPTRPAALADDGNLVTLANTA